MGKSGFFDFFEQTGGGRRPATPPPAPATAGPRASTGPAQAAGEVPKPSALSVSELTARIERAIKGQIPETLHVRGEISNFHPNQSSGHAYFTLKDKSNCINCVMWRSDAIRLRFAPADGLELLATGRVGIYGPQGRYQLYVTTLQPLGKGALELAFQQLRTRLEAAGLFAAERKRPLPRYPRTVAIVTGADTAALQDILKVLRRHPWLRLLLYPVPVQGQGAAPRIAAALAHLSERGRDQGVDVVLLGRGGGSLEDLWAFNEEVVARAIADCSIPIVTGIGHEVDISIADLVADYHAHTPTEAAQVITTHWRTARDQLNATESRLRRATVARLDDARQRLAHIERHETFRRPLDRIHSYRQLLDDRQRAMTLALAHRLHAGQRRLQDLRSRLDRHMPARLGRLREQIELVRQNLSRALSIRLRRTSDRLTRAADRLNSVSPRFRIPLHGQRLDALEGRLDRAMK